VSEETARRVSVLAGQAGYLIATAARAPSVHNTQPWRFRVGKYAIELYADPARKLQMDPVGREMLISCGAALFGLRLAIRSLCYQPMIDLLPDPKRLRLLAIARLGAAQPMTARERQLLEALPHRHTHRGPWDPGPLPAGLAAGIQHDALAEGAELVIIDRALSCHRLADIIAAAGRRQDLDPVAREEVLRWTRGAPDLAYDGVPAHAFHAQAAAQVEVTLRQLPGLAAPRQPPPRCWSHPVMAGPTGCEPGRRCTGCWPTPPAHGCSRACTPSR